MRHFGECCDPIGSRPKGCSNYAPVYYNINDRGCCSRVPPGTVLVEFHLTHAWNYNECCCACTQRQANIIRVSTDDLHGLEELLKAKGVKAEDALFDNTGALNVNVDGRTGKQDGKYGMMADSQL